MGLSGQSWRGAAGRRRRGAAERSRQCGNLHLDRNPRPLQSARLASRRGAWSALMRGVVDDLTLEDLVRCLHGFSDTMTRAQMETLMETMPDAMQGIVCVRDVGSRDDAALGISPGL